MSVADPSAARRGLTRIGFSLLVSESLVVALAIPVVGSSRTGVPAYALAALTGLAVLLLALAGWLRRAPEPAIVLGSIAQLATLAWAVALSLALAFLVVVFGALWCGWLVMRRQNARAVPAGQGGGPDRLAT